MTHQLTFEELRRSRRDDPHTSRAAARAARGLAGEHHRRILAVMAAGGDWTPEEIAAQAGLSSLQVSRRLFELAAADCAAIVPSGATRATSSGRQARAWRLT